jgi:glycosyltransferase involved in cell wall biosynthesis
MAKTLVSYHHFPHYRKGVFKELVQRNPDTTLMTSVIDSFDNIPSMLPLDGCKHIVGKGYWFYGKHFQPSLVKESIFGKYDVYIFLANPNFISTWLAALFARLRGKRVVFWGHGFCSDDKSFKNLVRKLFFSLAHCFYCYGYRSKSIAKSFGFQPANLYVGFNSLDYFTQLKIRKKIIDSHLEDKILDITQTETLKIICVSRLTGICHYNLLFYAAEQAKNDLGLVIQILMIGDGPEKTTLEELAIKLNLDVNFMGALYDEERVGSLIYKSDITVSPGKVGLTAMHSLMFGTPVISHSNAIEQMPEVEAIVDGFTGLLFKQGDVDALAQALFIAKNKFLNRNNVRINCFSVIDQIYNPKKQVDVLLDAIAGLAATEGNDVTKINWFK